MSTINNIDKSLLSCSHSHRQNKHSNPHTLASLTPLPCLQFIEQKFNICLCCLNLAWQQNSSPCKQGYLLQPIVHQALQWIILWLVLFRTREHPYISNDLIKQKGKLQCSDTTWQLLLANTSKQSEKGFTHSPQRFVKDLLSSLYLNWLMNSKWS